MASLKQSSSLTSIAESFGAATVSNCGCDDEHLSINSSRTKDLECNNINNDTEPSTSEESKVNMTESQKVLNNKPSMDRFFERIRTDLMFELRNLQHGERPVTGQNRRETIQKFMQKNLVTESKTAVNIDTVETEIHRPEAVVVEVQAVVDLRPVSSLLQSTVFRRQLENALRGSLSNHRPIRNTPVNQRTRLPASPTVSRNGSPVSIRNSSSRSSPVAEETRQTFQVRPQLARSESTESVDSFTSARSSYGDDDDPESESEAGDINENVTAFERVANRPEGPDTLNTHEQHVPANEQELSPNRDVWNDITSRQREEIIDEIHELVHSRLVSSTLQGDFRTVLELIARDHLSASGTNGRAVQEFIGTLPRGGVQRNDFSDIGLGPTATGDNDNWDTISIASISAHAVPYTQTNTYLTREIQSLKSQMSEMKNMLKLTLDLQMDTQRAIRQEVAAAMHHFTAPEASSISAFAQRPSPAIGDTHCIICLDRASDTVLYQCGHMCVCFTCGRDLMSRGHKCPVCRAPIKDVIRAYKTNAD